MRSGRGDCHFDHPTEWNSVPAHPLAQPGGTPEACPSKDVAQGALSTATGWPIYSSASLLLFLLESACLADDRKVMIVVTRSLALSTFCKWVL